MPQQRDQEMDGLQVLAWASGHGTTKMTKHGQARMVRKRRLLMTRMDAAAEIATGVWGVAHVKAWLPCGLRQGGRSPMMQGGLPGDGVQPAGQPTLGLSLGGA